MSSAPVNISQAAAELETGSGGVIVAVLGYSSRGRSDPHPICAARLARGAEVVSDARAVVLSGWARQNGFPSEAALMWDAWPEAGVPVVSDPYARTTAESAVQVAALADALDVDEIRVVTSRWHMRRALFLFRGARFDIATGVTPAHAEDRPTVRRSLRELGGWVVAPAQLRVKRRAVTRRDG